MITTDWQLGSRFRAWAHMLGYGGHFLTKSPPLGDVPSVCPPGTASRHRRR